MKLKYAVVLYEGPNNWNARAPDVPGCLSVGRDIGEMRLMMGEAPKLSRGSSILDRRSYPLAKTHGRPKRLSSPMPAFGAEIAAEYPDDPTSKEDGWSPPSPK